LAGNVGKTRQGAATCGRTSNGTYSTTNTLPAAQFGIYHWSAKYNGDSNNKAVSDNGANESATVNPDPKAQIAPAGTMEPH
jgi:hypothetical protein